MRQSTLLPNPAAARGQAAAGRRLPRLRAPGQRAPLVPGRADRPPKLALAVRAREVPGVNAIVFAQQAITGAESISLLAIPFFVCAGIMMNYTGVTARIMGF